MAEAPRRETLLVNITPREQRVAWVDNGMAQEVWVERTSQRGLVGNIYWGRVQRVLPGMQAAFIDIGLARAAFLYVADVYRPEDTPESEPIEKLLQPGQWVMVQVTKNPLGSKGARVSMQISLPSRLLVYMPGQKVIGVSQKIEDEAERARLRELLCAIPEIEQAQGGFIVRTVAEGAQLMELRADLLYLMKLWEQISARVKGLTRPTCIYEELPLYLRVLRDTPAEQIEQVLVDSRETLAKMQEFARIYVPQLVELMQHYEGERPIFDLYNVEDAISQALEKRVPLKSGGYLVIDQTEALTTIDVNTGAFVGHKNLEETIYKTNMEATSAIARQLRLRNLGGMIIIDFIDMQEQQHREHVLEALKRALSRDRAKTTVNDFSPLGLLEMTRKRTRESLERTLCQPCPICEGRGTVKTPQTVAYEIFREITRMARQFDVQQYRVIASEAVVSYIMDEESDSVAELEAFINCSVSFQAEATYPPEAYDVVMM
ncbi:MAG TPA: ribonuclease G [Sulfurivirga caldicuralii]|nr:ribonuclease G [Sulfurivirga caldicuralii]